MKEGTCIYHSPFGPMALTVRDGKLVRLKRCAAPHASRGTARGGLFAETARQLDEYFAGRRRVFDIPVGLDGTPFQKKVWEALTRIPYGETRAYGWIAAAIGKPQAARAVGHANHLNPVAIIVPCHRVIGADGSLTGYAGGLEMKRQLLALEQKPVAK